MDGTDDTDRKSPAISLLIRAIRAIRGHILNVPGLAQVDFPVVKMKKI